MTLIFRKKFGENEFFLYSDGSFLWEGPSIGPNANRGRMDGLEHFFKELSRNLSYLKISCPFCESLMYHEDPCEHVKFTDGLIRK